MKKGDLLEVTIQDMAFGGDGVARHEGRVIFVPMAASGDRLNVRITGVKKDFARAEITGLLQAGPGRCEPKCPYFGLCGGCQYQHLDYETQLVVKEKQLRDVLERIGGITAPEIKGFLRSPQAYGYRNRISVHHENGKIGYRGCDGRTLVEIQECAIASVEVNRKLRHLLSKPGTREHYSLRESDIPNEGFYQVNRFLLEPLRDAVAAEVTPGVPLVLECYGGSGFFTAAYADRTARIILAESNPKLVQEARKTMPGHVEIHEEESETVLAGWINNPGLPGMEIIVDPPREGLSPVMRQLLADMNAQKLIYLSCNPSTLARDLKELSPAWKPLHFQPIDLFPQTAHFECLAVCVPRRAGTAVKV